MKLNRSIISVKSSFDDSDDIKYWLSRLPEERFQHIERLRKINYGYKTTKRLQRILEVVSKTSS